MAEIAEGSNDCLICLEPATFRWTDTHGIAQCGKCGAPYRLYHYEGEGDSRKRVNRLPNLRVLDSWIEPLKKYWAEKKRPMPGGFSFDPGYEVSTAEDREAFDEYFAHPAPDAKGLP